MLELQQTNIVDELSRMKPKRLIDLQFEKFHKENPKVYQELVALTQQAYDRGRKRVGMRMLFEVIRWNRYITTTDPEFKMNNSYTSRYARLIMAENPHFRGIFETREHGA